MKSILAFGILFFALSFCGITDKIKEQMGDSKTTTDSITSNEDTETTETDSDSTDSDVEKAELTDEQQEIVDDGNEVKWDDQGISFVVPNGWNKIAVNKQMFNYGSPSKGFLIGTISIMPDNLPAKTSLDAQHTQALQQLKNGKYETVRWLELDGIKGVEWVEAPSENKGDPRRHQWIGFRNYQGQNQMLNIMVSTKSGEFDDKKDTYSAILYSMKTDK